MKRIIELARINNMRWVPHNWSTAINSAASMQARCLSSRRILDGVQTGGKSARFGFIEREIQVREWKTHRPRYSGSGNRNRSERCRQDSDGNLENILRRDLRCRDQGGFLRDWKEDFEICSDRNPFAGSLVQKYETIDRINHH